MGTPGLGVAQGSATGLHLAMAQVGSERQRIEPLFAPWSVCTVDCAEIATSFWFREIYLWADPQTQGGVTRKAWLSMNDPRTPNRDFK